MRFSDEYDPYFIFAMLNSSALRAYFRPARSLSCPAWAICSVPQLHAAEEADTSLPI